MVKEKKKDASTEQKILDAAQKEFISKGMAGARMQDIADGAGINKALLHYYFKNKEQLFITIFSKLTQDFWPRLSSIFESDEPLFDKIRSFCEVYIEKVIANPYIPLFVLYEMHQRPVSFIRKMFGGHPPRPQKLLLQIHEEVKAGNIAPVDPVQLVMNMISLCIFPFVGKPMIQMVMKIDEPTFNQVMQRRKKEVPDFIIASIRK